MTFGKYTIVYNGEIYNTDEIRRELISAGYSFDTHCDTEVILKAYDKWKEESCKSLTEYLHMPYGTMKAKNFSCAGTE